MGLIFPTIPYKSQLDPDANELRNDCGPASLAMILNAFGKNVTTNAVYRRTGTAANGYISLSQLMRAGDTYEVPFGYYYSWNIARFKQAVDEGQTMICLVHYGGWSQIDPGVSTQSSFTGPHFVVVVAYDEVNIYVNDPLWYGSRRLEGYRRAWNYQEFNAAWGSNNLDGQRDFSGIYCRLTLPTETYEGIDGFPSPDPEGSSFQLDPEMSRRIMAWAYMNGIPEPDITSPAVANAYIAAMGSWGEIFASHEVEDSDNLGLLALRYYGDPMKYPVIQIFNGLAPTDTIHDEDILLIPEPIEVPVVIPPEEIPEGGSTPHIDRIYRLHEWKYDEDSQPPNNRV
ncbi:MAG: hypothetical protein FVQ83_14730 [Chloroflexi bacterium]|nr:hypothetical protein [Chloroflexota bacterium]